MANKVQTERIDWTRQRAFGRITADDLVGREAIYRTADGRKLVGTITGEVVDHMPYLRVQFPGGSWARLGDVVTLVKG